MEGFLETQIRVKQTRVDAPTSQRIDSWPETEVDNLLEARHRFPGESECALSPTLSSTNLGFGIEEVLAAIDFPLKFEEIEGWRPQRRRTRRHTAPPDAD